MLAAPIVLSLTSAACAEKNEPIRMTNARILVAYLTRSGNTRVIAGTLQRALRADLFEIRPARPYPEDYEQHVAQAMRERDSGFEPPLGETVSNIAGYDEIYLGFPVWGETMPPPVRTFLGRTICGVRPFAHSSPTAVTGSAAVLSFYRPTPPALGSRTHS
jgi:hypothetical protein